MTDAERRFQRAATRFEIKASLDRLAHACNEAIYRVEGERVKGIEPSYAAWEAAVLPLNYTRVDLASYCQEITSSDVLEPLL